MSARPARLLEPPLQRAFWNLRVPDDARHHTSLAEVLVEPLLTAAHQSIGVRLLAPEWFVRQLPLIVPLQLAGRSASTLTRHRASSAS